MSLRKLKSSPSCNFTTSSIPACQNYVHIATALINEKDINHYNIYADCHNASSTETGDTARNGLKPLKHNFPCIDTDYVISYLNQDTVKKSLNIDSRALPFDVCSRFLEDPANYEALYTSMRPQITDLLNGGLKGILYYGDVDIVCNFLGGQWFADGLNRTVLSQYRKWHLNGQVGGFIKQYDGLTYATVRGSGHLVPTDKPEAAFRLFADFIGA